MTRLLILLVALSWTAPLRARTPAAWPADAVRDAIVEAVQARMGTDARVTIERLQVAGWRPVRSLRAVPHPAARIGEPMHFKLVGLPNRGGGPIVAGRAVAIVRVDVEHVRARTLVERGRAFAAGEVEASHEPLMKLPLRRLPRVNEVSGARALVDLAPGDIVTPSAVAARPAVRTGQLVEARVRVGNLEAMASLTAAQDGVEGAVIRVVNKDTRRELRGRVVGPGVVEVIR